MNDNDQIADLLRKVSFSDEEFAYRDETWNEIQSDIRSRRQRRRLYNIWLQAAASVIIACTVVGFGMQKSIRSGDGVKQVILPDGSMVDLAARSTLRYNSIGWQIARNIRLEGDATFSVRKGRRFCVRTDLGTVTVLGTRFYIAQSDGRMEVACHEGSVQVNTNAGAEILYPGERVDCSLREIVRSKIPQPLPEYLEYTNASLEAIVRKVASVFSLDVSGIDRCQGLRFTGYVSTTDPAEAAEVLFGCCGLNYALCGKKLLIFD